MLQNFVFPSLEQEELQPNKIYIFIVDGLDDMNQYTLVTGLYTHAFLALRLPTARKFTRYQREMMRITEAVR